MISFKILSGIGRFISPVTGSLPGRMAVPGITAAAALLAARGVVRTAHLVAHDTHQAYRGRRKDESTLHWCGLLLLASIQLHLIDEPSRCPSDSGLWSLALRV